MSAFGDFEVADAWDPTAPPAPEQVAYRLHRLRRAVDLLAGRDPGEFDDLTVDEQTLAFEIGDAVVVWVATAPVHTGARLAVEIHSIRRFWDRVRVRPWDDLSPDERAIAVALADLIVAWLRREGSLL